MLNIKHLKSAIICIAIPLTCGAIAGWATSNNIKNWYVFLNKPSFNPPNWVFGPVWTILYVLMGIGLYLISNKNNQQKLKQAKIIWWLQLAFNFAWSFIFFYFHEIGWALLDITLLWLNIVLLIWKFYPIDKTAAFLQIPYLLWVSFATVLNAAIFSLN